MQLERKIELMEKYDFSEAASNFTEHGFGNAQVSFHANLHNFLKYGSSMIKEERKKSIDHFYFTYGFMRMKYDSIDFKELEDEIDTEEDRKDFFTLFKTREILPKLGRALDKFIRYCHENNFVVDANSQEYLEADKLAQELSDADKPSYRYERIKELKKQLTLNKKKIKPILWKT